MPIVFHFSVLSAVLLGDSSKTNFKTILQSLASMNYSEAALVRATDQATVSSFHIFISDGIDLGLKPRTLCHTMTTF